MAADRKQVALNGLQQRGLEVSWLASHCAPDYCVEFVDLAIGSNPNVVLSYAASAKETRVPLVAGLGIDGHAEKVALPTGPRTALCSRRSEVGSRRPGGPQGRFPSPVPTIHLPPACRVCGEARATIDIISEVVKNE